MIKRSGIQDIFFDESGMTGSHLMNDDQPYFVYAGIAITEEEADSLVSELIKKYRLQGTELKASNLLKHENGRKAILELVRKLKGKIKIVCFHKKYALAAKFFEYIFEPCIAPISTLFYRNQFHKFIATLLYINFQAKTESAEKIFENFQEMMRHPNPTRLNQLFSSEGNEQGIIFLDSNNPIHHIVMFAELNHKTIYEELASFSPTDPKSRWVLDLSSSALYSILSIFGEEYEQIRAFCDESKPLKDHQELFNNMVQRSDRLYSVLGDEEEKPIPISFNLSEPLKFVDSKSFKAIQLADIVSGAMCFFLKNKTDSYGKKLFKLLMQGNSFSNSNVIPDIDELDLRRPQTVLNAMALLTLAERSVNHVPLLDNPERYYDVPKFYFF